MTEKELRELEKKVNERLNKRLKEDKILPGSVVLVEYQRLFDELGLSWPFSNVYGFKDVKGDIPYSLFAAHNLLVRKMEKLQKAYDEMEESFEAYKKEVVKNWMN